MRAVVFNLLVVWVSFFPCSASAENFSDSLKSALYGTGTVLGRFSFASGEETDLMLQFFQDGTAEYDVRSLDGTTISCSGRLDFTSLYEDQPEYQTIEFKVVPGQSVGQVCPKDGRFILNRSIYTENKDEIFVLFETAFVMQSEEGSTAAGSVFLTDGVPLVQDFEAESNTEPSEPSSIASGAPQYDGVYVGLDDGSYVEMEELVRIDSRLHFGGMPYAITRPFGDPASNRPVPVVDIDEVRSIFLKSGTDVITGVQPVFNAEELLFQGLPATSGVYVRIGDKDFESSQFKELYASSDCSYAPDLMNRMTISSTEYELVFEGSRLSPRNLASAPVNTKWSAINPVYDPSMPSKCVGSVSSSGFSVIVEGPTHRGINTSMGPLRGSVYWVRFSD